MRKPLLISAVTVAVLGAGVIIYMNQEQPKTEENRAIHVGARDPSTVTHVSTSDNPQPEFTPPVVVEPAGAVPSVVDAILIGLLAVVALLLASDKEASA